MKKILTFLFVALLAISGCKIQPTNINQVNSDLTRKPSKEIIVNNFEECVAAGNLVMESYPRQCNHNGQHFVEELVKNSLNSSFSYTGKLEDVNGGKSSGVANANFNENSVVVSAEFSNLPKLEDDYFYEGWLVRQNPFAFISTGKVEINSELGYYMNYIEIDKNLDGYDFYVLTLEPDDNNAAPADHILEGKMSKKL